MKNLLKVMELIQQIERFQLESKYRSTFEWEDENNLIIDCFCFQQACAYKMLFDLKGGIVVYMEGNSKLRILNLIN